MSVFKGWQVDLSVEQRARLEELARSEGRSAAELVREAVDAYLTTAVAELQPALDATFGSLPDLRVPGRMEWDR